MTTRRLLLWPAGVAAALLLSGATAALAASPDISLSASGSTPFSTVTVAGTGFGAGETVALSFGLNSASAAANSEGSFSGATIAIPNVPSGLYYVIAVGQTTGTVAFESIWVNSFFPTAGPSSWYIAPGTSITWTGSGFSPNESITVRDSGGTTVASFSANSSGAFSGAGSTLVPFSARNSVVAYSLRGATSGANLTFNLAVGDLYPYANPTTWYALPGTGVSFSGSGFAGGETVNLMLGSDPTILGSASADGSGSFMTLGPVNLPFGTVANYKLVGAQSGAVALVPITLASFYPSLTPSAYYAAPGSTITLGGTGFAPNESVEIKVGTEIKGAATANSMGAFSGFSLALPPAPNTMPVISGTGAQSGAVASFTMAIGDYYAWINFSAWWAQGGTPLVISGHNFAQGENVVAKVGDTTIGNASSNGMGDVTINTTVPYVMPGPATITLRGDNSGASANATMTVAPVWTDLQLGSYAVTRGTAVQLIGSGYLANEPVEVRTDRTGSTVVHSFTTSGTGTFNDSGYVIPADFAEGLMTITVKSLYSFDTKEITFWVGI